jgi:hypothetical protein
MEAIEIEESTTLIPPYGGQLVNLIVDDDAQRAD